MAGEAHTPGPWRVNAGFARVEVPDRDAPICELLWPTELRSEDETRANARLIAAAPDLLEAALNMKGLYDTPAERRRRSEDPFYAEAIDGLRAAIARATQAGEQG